MPTLSMPLPTGDYETRRTNALNNAGGDVNSQLYKNWLATYGSGGSNPQGVPYGDLASGINSFMNSQALNTLNSNLPGYANAVGQRAQNTQSMLEGNIPDDVITQLSQGAAERGIGGGSPGSPNANAAYLRALGLTSLDMMNQGSQQLSQSIADTPVPELWNPMSLYMPTVLGQQEQLFARQGQQQQQADAQRAAMSAAWNSNRDSGNYRQGWSAISGLY